MENIRLKILKTSETGKKIIELFERRDSHFELSQALAKELGFENAWVDDSEIRGKIGGFSNPNNTVDLRGYCRPDENGMYRPRASNKKVWEKIEIIGAVRRDELHKLIGINLCFYEGVGLEELEDSFIIEFNKEWKKRLNGNTDVQEIKTSEYYKLKGE